jgi:hypothetical protein
MNKRLLALIAIATIATLLVAVAYAVSVVTWNPAPPVLYTVNPRPSASPSPSPTPTPLTGNLAITFNGTTATAGDTATITVSLSPIAATPVSLYANGTFYETQTSTASGLATFVIPNVEVGTYIFTATAQSVTLP